MVRQKISKKIFILFTLCLLIYPFAINDNISYQAIAKKINKKETITTKYNEKEQSKSELLDLIHSIKDTISNLDSRIGNIENRLDNLNSEKQPKQETLTEKWLNFSKVASSPDKQPTKEKQPEAKKEVKEEQQTVYKNVSKVENQEKALPTKQIEKLGCNISVEKGTEKNYETGSVVIGQKKVICFKSKIGNKDSYDRAKSVANELQEFLSKDGNIKKLLPVLRKGQYVADINGKQLFTVDKLTAQRSGMPEYKLTLAWVNNIRTALGVEDVKRVAYQYASRSLSPSGRPEDNNSFINFDTAGFDYLLNIIPSIKKDVSTGSASWYGGVFNGRRSADGSRFNMMQMTAAHKSLPFGTIVKVTNINNKKECFVKITDRGPFIAGRIIDLSKEAADKIGMLGSGVAKVKVEVMGKVVK